MTYDFSETDMISIKDCDEIAGLAERVGQSMIDDGNVVVVFLAGGEGRRLGFDGPKCLYPIAGKPILGRLMEEVPSGTKAFVMANNGTSERISQFVGNSAEVFLQECTFGYGSDLLQSPEQFPDGHGGFLQAFFRSHCIGSEYNEKTFFVCQADNPSSPVCSPLLIGMHHITRSQMTVAVVEKDCSEEKMGSACKRSDGMNCVMEYGTPGIPSACRFGNAGVYVFDGSFLGDCAYRSHLKFHLRPQPDGSFRREKFIFDLMPFAKRSQFIEMRRSEVFTPVKDAETAEAVEKIFRNKQG